MNNLFLKKIKIIGTAFLLTITALILVNCTTSTAVNPSDDNPDAAIDENQPADVSEQGTEQDTEQNSEQIDNQTSDQENVSSTQNSDNTSVSDNTESEIAETELPDPIEADLSETGMYIDMMSLIETSFKGSDLILVKVDTSPEIENQGIISEVFKILLSTARQDRDPSADYYIGVAIDNENDPVYIQHIRKIRAFMAYNIDEQEFLNDMFIGHYNFVRGLILEIESRLGAPYLSYNNQQPVITVDYFPASEMSTNEFYVELIEIFKGIGAHETFADSQGFCIVKASINDNCLNFITTSAIVQNFLNGDIEISGFIQQVQVVAD